MSKESIVSRADDICLAHGLPSGLVTKESIHVQMATFVASVFLVAMVSNLIAMAST